MKYTWLFIIPPIAIAIIIFIAWYRYRIHSHDRDLKRVAVIAHTKTIKMLPAYRHAVTRYRILMACAAVAFLAALFSLTAVAARPTSRDERRSESEKRDVVLCLDVSGSMYTYIDDITTYFSEIVSGLDDARISLTIFDGKPANLIPLTDDYEAVKELTDSLSTSFQKIDTPFGSPISSYATRGNSSSAIGDGVMGCANSLDLSDDNQRAKSIIIATDNEYGTNSQSIDIGQVARYAERYGVTFYGLYTGSSYSISHKNEFIDAVKITNGSFYDLNDLYERPYGQKTAIAKDSNHTIETIIHEIMDQETAKMEGAPEIVYVDKPEIMLYISSICFAIFVILIWRLKL
jgi:hypothetical protein